MKKYKVIVTPRAQQDIKAYVDYIKNTFKNPQAARSVFEDYVKTRKTLSLMAETIQEQNSELLNRRGLKRINFRNHDYFMLFWIDCNNIVRITNIFHDLEDFESKLDR